MKSIQYAVLSGLYILQSASASAQAESPHPMPPPLQPIVEFSCGGNISGDEFRFSFAKNSSRLPEYFWPRLDCIVSILGPKDKVQIVGYRSQAEAKSQLAAKRAKAVARAFEKRGLSSQQMTIRACTSVIPEDSRPGVPVDEIAAEINRQVYVIIGSYPKNCP